MKTRTIAVITAVVLMAPVFAFGMASFDFPVTAPLVTFVSGDVTVMGSASTDWDRVEVGRLLASGDTIKTGPASKAEISCATGKMRLYENTVIIVPEVVDEGDKKDVRAVTLEDGAGLFRIKKRGAEKGFEVKTSNIIAGVKGTLFGVLTNKARKISSVAVYSGRVLVTDLIGTPSTATTLGRGMKVEVEEDSGFGDPDDFEPDDVWRQWKLQQNPSPLSLGKSAPPGVGVFRADWIEEGDDDDRSCPPVVDNDGNVVVP